MFIDKSTIHCSKHFCGKTCVFVCLPRSLGKIEKSFSHKLRTTLSKGWEKKLCPTLYGRKQKHNVVKVQGHSNLILIHATLAFYNSYIIWRMTNISIILTWGERSRFNGVIIIRHHSSCSIIYIQNMNGVMIK